FELDNDSLELKTFSAELLNNINVLDINNINSYKKEKIENKTREIEKEVISSKWYKRFFGIKDTVKYTESYKEKKTVIDVKIFYNDVVDPISKQFNKIINDCTSHFDKIF